MTKYFTLPLDTWNETRDALDKAVQALSKIGILEERQPEPKLVLVSMTVSQRVTYNKIFEMPAEDYAKAKASLNTLAGTELSNFEETLADKYIDWLDSDSTEITQLELFNELN